MGLIFLFHSFLLLAFIFEFPLGLRCYVLLGSAPAAQSQLQVREPCVPFAPCLLSPAGLCLREGGSWGGGISCVGCDSGVPRERFGLWPFLLLYTVPVPVPTSLWLN